MKKLILTSVIISLFLTLNAEIKEKKVESKINEVTVFLSGAQIFRSGSTYLTAGTNKIVFSDLSHFINQNSIQVSGKGNFVILSVVQQINYLVDHKKPMQVKVLQDSIELFNNKIRHENSLLKVYLAEENMIKANQSISGQQNGVIIEQLKALSDFYRITLMDNILKQTAINEKISGLNKILFKLNNQLSTLNSTGATNVSEIVVTVNAKENTNADFDFNYIVSNAGWIPSYNLRAKDVNSPIDLNLKADVYQTTGVEWNNIKLTLSTGNPMLSSVKPVLNPWYLYFNQNFGNRGLYNSFQPQKMETSVLCDSNEGLVLGKKALAQNASYYTNTYENQTTTEYRVEIPYTIKSDGKSVGIEVKKFELPATYEYYCAPKIDKEAFLIARVTDWEKHNLLPGSVNLYFEGTFVGNSYIDVRNISDTLDISLGRDKNIVVTRIKLKEFSSKSIIGSNRKVTHTWEINVKNNKKQAINIVIEDQFPISNVKEITVDKEEMSEAKYNESTGSLKWTLSLEPGDKKKMTLSYSVKYPKDQNLIIR